MSQVDASVADDAAAIRAALTQARDAVDRLLTDDGLLARVQQAAALLTACFSNGGRVFACGNGGSMFDAMHFAEELAGRYREDRAGLPALSISDPGHLTGVGNDYGYEFVFSRYLDSHARPGDVLLAISTSGGSRNVVTAAAGARRRGIKVIGLTGKSMCALAEHADIFLGTPAGQYSDRVQELHIKLLHVLIELTERHLFPENYL